MTDLQVTEDISGVWHYHLSVQGASSRGLCGAWTMPTSLPLSSWNRRIPNYHIPESFCSKCEAARLARKAGALTDDHIYTVKEISLIGECVRKWAAKYRHRLHDPKHPAAQAGIDVHAILERMLREGPHANVDPESEVGGWARALYPMAPPGCHAELEQGFPLEFEGGETYRSSFRIDFVFPDFSGFGDWKTCAGVKWSVTDLANDLQANLETYGFAKVMGFPPDRPVQLLWLYVDKKTGKAWRVPGAISFAQAEEWLRAHALPRLRLIRALRALDPTPPLDALPFDRIACTPPPGSNGGIRCPFIGPCQYRTPTTGLTTEQLYQLASK